MTRRTPLPLVALLAVLTLLPSAVAANGQEAALATSDLAGLRLRTIGPAAMSGRIVDLAVVESDPYVFYVASATGGLWKTTNNGVTFDPVFEREAVHSIGDVAVHQRSTDVVWVGTGERANRQSSSWGNGVYRSTDGGDTWEHVGLDESHHIGRIALHPDDPEVAWVAAMGHLWGPNEERGVYRTSDGGASWERLLHVDADTGAVDVAVDPGNPDLLYAATYQRRRRAFGFHGGGPGSGIWRSEDGGDSWTELTGAVLDPDAPDNPDHPDGTLVNGLPAGEYGRIGLSIHRDDPRIVYATVEQGDRYTASTSYEGERFAGVYRSEDRGLTWQHMSDWNPRPMYASQILVDPSDDQRIYQQNSFSYSDDGGRTWSVPRQSIHSDDRYLWVNPADSRHLMKASDGALGISYDRGETWLWAENLPVSQYYRVSVDLSDPYNVLGGLQDNGTWIGPNETDRAEGIINADWRPIGGGDGFVAIADPDDPNRVYVESQYLGLTRLDLGSAQQQSIRPGNPEGYEFGRRNWRRFGTEEAARLMEQEMEPANWDGPYILSPHDPATIYAGTGRLYVSRDGGSSWTDLGRLANEWERSEVEIMGQEPTRRVASLDDGVPYFATITTIAESPLQQGLLWVGTDDGNVQVSYDAGESFTNVVERIPGVPPRTWVSDVEPSPHRAETVFVSFDGHTNDDFTNYLFRSDDAGASWRSIVGDLPEGLVIRTVAQDSVNPDLIYAATEFGFWLTIDGGDHWVELQNNMPTVAVNDFAVHPRDDDLVLGTHGRGVWILDSIRSLRELTPEVVDSDAALFSIFPARMMRKQRTTARWGDTMFRGENPPGGAIIDYWLGSDRRPEAGAEESEADEAAVRLAIHDAEGGVVRELEPGLARGINRVVWDLRHAPLPAPAVRPSEPDPVRADQRPREEGPGRGPAGPLVVPGTYVARLDVDGARYEQRFEVHEDPRIQASAVARRSWTTAQLELGELWSEVNALVGEIHAREDEITETGGELPDALTVLREQAETLRTRVSSLRGSLEGWVGAPTADQRAREAFVRDAHRQLLERWEEMRTR